MKGNLISLWVFAVVFILSTCAVPVMSQVLENYDQTISFSPKTGLTNLAKSASLRLDFEQFAQAQIKIALPEGAGIFFNDQLLVVADKDTMLIWEAEQLKDQGIVFDQMVNMVVYKKDGLRPDQVSVQKGYFPSLDEENPSLEEAGLPIPREKNAIRDFLFTAVLVILFLFSLFRAFFPAVFSIFWNFRNLLSFEDLWESVGISKIYSAELLFYLFTISLGISLFAVVAVYGANVPVLGQELGTSLNFLFLLWLSFALGLTLIFFFKFLWLGANTFVFELHKIALPHFFYLLKITGLSLLTVLFVLVVIESNSLLAPEQYYIFNIWLFFGIYAMGIIALLFWLSKKIGFKNYHLFSYICTSELIPFLVIFKLILG